MRIIVDTNVLVDGLDFKDFEKVFIPITVLEELDKLSHSQRDITTSFKAKSAIREIESFDNVEIVLTCNKIELEFSDDVVDNKILCFVLDLFADKKVDYFYTKDIAFKAKAKAMKIPLLEGYKNNKCDVYTGYKEVKMTEQELATHYEKLENKFGLLINEYLIISDIYGEVVDKQKWTEKGFVHVASKNVGTRKKGVVSTVDFLSPLDAYQACAIDSINKNDFTILTGKAGSGKTLIGLSWILNALDTQEITKAIVVFDNVELLGSTKQGYYPGSRTEKAMATGIGGILSSKLGSVDAVMRLITLEKLELIPACDIRGIEVGATQAIFCSESQNFSKYILKTIIQRAKEGAKIIIEGDILEQLDMRHCSFEDTGIYRATEVFKGSPYFGCVRLKKNYRSPLADIADKM